MGEHYPILITKASDDLEKILPLLKLGLRTIKTANGVAGLAQCFFPGIPRLPADIIDRMDDTLHKLSSEPSALFDDREKNQLRGASLRKLQLLLEENDADGSFCGL